MSYDFSFQIIGEILFRKEYQLINRNIILSKTFNRICMNKNIFSTILLKCILQTRVYHKLKAIANSQYGAIKWYITQNGEKMVQYCMSRENGEYERFS